MADILVVDDEPSVRTVLGKMLEQDGHEVRGAVDGEDALIRLAEKPADLAIVDIMMPRMNGLELVRRMKADPLTSEIPVMILTVLVTVETRIEGYRLGVDDYLTKPFHREDLMIRVNRLLKMREDKVLMAQKFFELGLKVSFQEELVIVSKGRDFASATLDLRKMILGVVRSLARTLDARDNYNQGHSEWVSKYSVQIATKMNCSQEDVEKLELAALLHDIGKVGVKESILKKPARLTPEEAAAIQRHPLYSAEMIQPVAYLRDLVPAVRHHHERYDGKGFPDGLSGKSIPFPARILTVADAFEVMTSERHYPSAFSFDKALAEFRRCQGMQFDPEVVDAFLVLAPDLHKQSRGGP